MQPAGAARAPWDSQDERPCVSKMQRLRMIRATIGDSIGTDVAKVEKVLDHSLGGGKGMRALVAHVSCDWFGMGRERCNEVAAVMEMIHVASLLHDDIVDSALTRRDRPSANHAFGSDAAVLAGDFLYSRASQMLCAIESLPLLASVADATNMLAEGEMMQLERKGARPTRGEYYEIIRRKTAELFAACSSAGPVSAGCEPLVEPLRSYGLNLGMAFQVADDCLDYVGDDASTGKRRGMDFRDGKATLPLLCGLEMADKKERARLEKLAGNADDDNGFEEASALLSKLGAVDAALAEANRFADSAKKALSQAPEGDFSRMLSTLVDRAVNRSR